MLQMPAPPSSQQLTLVCIFISFRLSSCGFFGISSAHSQLIVFIGSNDDLIDNLTEYVKECGGAGFSHEAVRDIFNDVSLVLPVTYRIFRPLT